MPLPPHSWTNDGFFLHRCVSLVFIGAGMVHFLEGTMPGWGGGKSDAFHFAFAAINSLFAFLFLRRPRWLVYAFVVLMLEQFYSHGGAALHSLKATGQISLRDASVLVFLPSVLVGVLLPQTTRRG